ncbi:HlyD family secretion protein [Oceanihabitans sediminis]|uniref:Biotin/lipoyl-binding protein n=1 Tax=Oceanihabitans sediminis TaxID=1812012 RepID=A0A368P7Y9_9FLAO|nr:biotin/lipoyl-binding protein [Oceanihabitans sediminis]MDX1278435.1 efflux RND transporter periplasmic adaptor subunit [Oceanihabitans sediminis]MDX1773966.1 efflux RND transporter periplasmic adaptor subunit [Oceanihabitans sediminis]RBP32008.1 HlyD family secretion protein [Oceanihabitans sediminis]RCU58668.1 biotin/lipoyl-binding protein [Oceanihabitans sediminis]
MKLYNNILLGCLALLALQSCKDDQITTLRGKVKFETISVSGKVPGRVEKLYVTEGQTVKKGDTLALLDIPEVHAKMMQAEGAIAAAKGQLDMAYNGATSEQLSQIEGKLNAGKAQLDFAQESYNRLKNMLQDSLISQQQFDEVKMKLNMAKAQVDGLEAKKKEIIKGARSEQIQQAKGQLDRALGAKEEVLSASNEQYLIAPANMSVETISLEEGELLTPGYTLFNGYKTESVYFRFTIPESKIYDFEVGQELTLVNPYTKEETKAKIIAIKQLAQYADITSTAPLYQLSESIYELKVVPAEDVSGQKFYTNATILIK